MSSDEEAGYDSDREQGIRTTRTITKETDEEKKAKEEALSEVEDLLDEWSGSHESSDYDPLSLLKRLSEILEKWTDEFLNRDPDPLDDRHPNSTQPKCALGAILKHIFRNDDFMNKLVISYILSRDNVELNIQGCRFLLGCIPGLDVHVVFQEPDDFIPRLYTWAKDDSNETLQAYAFGLLSSALEVPENASTYKNENTLLVPYALKKLKELKERMEAERREEEIKRKAEMFPFTSFAHLNGANEAQPSSEQTNNVLQNNGSSSNQADEAQPSTSGRVRARSNKSTDDDSNSAPPRKKRKTKNMASEPSKQFKKRIPSLANLQNLENSNSKWDIVQPLMIGNQQVYPLNLSMYQRYIFNYVTPTGEYQDLLSMTYEGDAMSLVLEYIKLENTLDVRLTFDALKYLTSLLVHRKFALEFVARGGVQLLLKIPRNSLASLGVINSFYYMSYCNDVMEVVCQLEDKMVDDVVSYALWCMEHSYESGMSNAVMFFSHALYFRTILDRFDMMDGARKMYNHIATLTLLQDDIVKNGCNLNDDQYYATSQCIKNACTAFKSYGMAQIFKKLETIRKSSNNKLPAGLSFPPLFQCDIASYKSIRSYEDPTWDAQQLLCNIFRMVPLSWKPIEELKKHGVMKLLTKALAGLKDWEIQAQKAMETLVSTLEVIDILCCWPPFQGDLLVVEETNDGPKAGLKEIIEIACGEFSQEGNIRIPSLKILIKCVYVPYEVYKKINNGPVKLRPDSASDKKEARKVSKSANLSGKQHLEMMWTALRKNDGLLVLMDLLNIKTPIIDADSIRLYAVITLCGLARCDEVRQILSKMPLIAMNEIQLLMREPILQDKRVEHAQFCKQGHHLLQIVTGKKMNAHQVKDFTHEKMHKQWIVENTKVNFNDKELLQLIHDHLSTKGYSNTASLLKSEAELPDVPAGIVAATPIRLKPLPSRGDSLTAINSHQFTSLQPRDGQESEYSLSGRRSSMLNNFTSPMINRSASVESNDNMFVTPTLSRRSLYKKTQTNNKRFLLSPMRIKPVTTTAFVPNKPHRGLDDILVEYFRQQHSHCTNPVTTCPPFSFFYPHRCPESNESSKQVIPFNFVERRLRRDTMRPYENVVSCWYDEKVMFSKFRSSKTVHEPDDTYTCAAFSYDDINLMLGMFTGEVHIVNFETGAGVVTHTCHSSAITSLQPSYDGTMLLTSSAYVRPYSGLWRIHSESLEEIRLYNAERSVKFSNLTLDKILAVGKMGLVTIHDTETNVPLRVFSGVFESGYAHTNPCFSPDDRIIFNNGHIYDVSTGECIHSYDKLSDSTIDVAFHPHGNQLIINTEVYDLRTNKVLHHVPDMNGCRKSFSSSGSVMLAATMADIDGLSLQDEESTPLRTFDTKDYSVITTFDLKKSIAGISLSNNNQQLCVIEKMKNTYTPHATQTSTQLRIYEVGKSKEDDDEGDEEEEEEPHSEQDEEENLSSSSDDEDGRGYSSSNVDSDNGVFDILNRHGGIRDRIAARRRRLDDYNIDQFLNDLGSSSSGSSSTFSVSNDSNISIRGDNEDDDDDDNASDDSSWRTVSQVDPNDIQVDEEFEDGDEIPEDVDNSNPSVDNHDVSDERLEMLDELAELRDDQIYNNIEDVSNDTSGESDADYQPPGGNPRNRNDSGSSARRRSRR